MTTTIKERTPQIAIIIVNYQTASLVLEHLDKADRQLAAFPGSEIVIVDNASPNGDAALLKAELAKRKFQMPVRLITAEDNGGFAAGNNVALRDVLTGENQPDYIFLQNPDAYPHENAFSQLVAFLEATPKAGIVGARLEGLDERPEVSAFRFFSAESDFISTARTGVFTKILSGALVTPPQKEGVFEVDWLCGAAVLIRREVFKDVGLLDEAYFLYYEETDFMLQMKRKGWERWYLSDAHYTHIIGQSSGVKYGKSKEKKIPDYWFDSRRYYFRKNHGLPYTVMADTAWLAGAAFYILRSLLTFQPTKTLRQNFARFLVHAISGKPRKSENA